MARKARASAAAQPSAKEFTLDGEVLSLARVPPSVEKIRAACEALKEGELLSNQGMSERAGVASMDKWMTREELQAFKVYFHGRKVAWGNRETVKRLKAELGVPPSAKE